MRPLALYALAVLYALDVLANALLGGRAGETLSKRAARNPDTLGWRELGRLLEWLDPGHLSYPDLERPSAVKPQVTDFRPTCGSVGPWDSAQTPP